MSNDKSISKFISLILRHKPEIIGITLDEHGWGDVSELIAGISRSHQIDMETLERIVAEDEKQRYSFNKDKTLICTFICLMMKILRVGSDSGTGSLLFILSIAELYTYHR